MAAAVLPYFLGAGDDLRPEIVEGIQQAISGRTDEEVAGGVTAVVEWAAPIASGARLPLPPQLVDRLIAALESRREIGTTLIMNGVRQLVVAGILSEDDRSRVAPLLGELLIEQKYERIDPDSREAVSVSLVRAECVRLAHALEKAGTSSPDITAWLMIVPIDPLPEVRFALATEG
jgi:hypothetical protein